MKKEKETLQIRSCKVANPAASKINMSVKGFIFIFIFFALILSIDSQAPNNYNKKGWSDAREYLKTYMDETASPCSNFTQFMCGDYGNQSDNEYQQFLEEKSKDTIETFGAAVENIKINDTIPSYSRIIRKFYDDCVNAKSIEDDPKSIQEIYDLLKNTFGTDFPPFGTNSSKKSTSEKDIWYTMGYMQRDLNQFLALSAVTLPLLAPQELLISAIVPGDKIPLHYFRNQTLQIAQTAHIKIDMKQLDEILSEVKALHDDWRMNGTSDSTAEIITTTLANISHEIPTINWSSYFKGLLPPDVYQKWTSQNNSVITLLSGGIQTKLVGEIFERHPKRAVITLMYGKAFKKFLAEYTAKYQESDLLASYTNVPPRSAVCLSYMLDHMPAASARVIFDYLEIDAIQWRHEIQLIAINIFSAMRLLLNSISYLSPATKERVNRKLDKITVNPGVPSWIMDDKKILRNNLEYNASLSLPMNFIEQERQNFLDEIKRLLEDNQTTEAEEVEEPPPTFELNSAYNPANMQIIVYLGLSIAPFFNIHYPLAVKYGQMGFLIGHELMHAFDSNGILVPAPPDDELLTEDELDRYKKHEQCLVNQYSQYCYQNIGTCLSGTTAIPDNIADIGGLKAAYAAYQFARDVVGDEPPIPGLTQFTGDQIFFMTFEKWLCSKNTPSAWAVAQDHTPNDARGLVALRNNPHFAASFKCAVGSSAAPIKPCEMWGEIYGSSKKSEIMK